MLVSIRPHRTWRPSIAIVVGRRRLPVVTLLNPTFEVNLAAADLALERVVEEGVFALAGVRSARFRSYLDGPSQMRTYLELINPPRPRFPPGGRARLYEMWGSAPRGARIEVTESLVVNALRRR
ncbi:MAG TPA: hypothetical protein VN973_12140 [Candidatus Dormibacteraeota bacterium]|nr:hypothetical protein [Candidatus Dormibacteraeota bacterium]